MSQRPTFSRLLLTLSACFLAVGGLLLTFLPAEVLGFLGADPTGAPVLLAQLCGAAWLGFAMLNWMSRGQSLGGIYGRPLIAGNLLHFCAGGLGAVKMLTKAPELAALWPVAIASVAFGVGFAVLMRRPPVPRSG